MKAAIAISAITIAMVLTPTAYAGHKWKHHAQSDFNDVAQVIRAEPITRTVQISEPRRECWQEEVRRPIVHAEGQDSAGKVVLGGIVGGVIGHQIGSGRGNRAATLAGTLIGAAVGHDMAMKSARTIETDHVDYVQRCRVSHETHTEERIEGYEVTYRYRGESFTSRMPYDPGKRLRVRVMVSPIYE
jgi:uncharacterized protein YcfJ